MFGRAGGHEEGVGEGDAGQEGSRSAQRHHKAGERSAYRARARSDRSGGAAKSAGGGQRPIREAAGEIAERVSSDLKARAQQQEAREEHNSHGGALDELSFEMYQSLLVPHAAVLQVAPHSPPLLPPQSHMHALVALIQLSANCRLSYIRDWRTCPHAKLFLCSCCMQAPLPALITASPVTGGAGTGADNRDGSSVFQTLRAARKLQEMDVLRRHRGLYTGFPV